MRGLGNLFLAHKRVRARQDETLPFMGDLSLSLFFPSLSRTPTAMIKTFHSRTEPKSRDEVNQTPACGQLMQRCSDASRGLKEQEDLVFDRFIHSGYDHTDAQGRNEPAHQESHTASGNLAIRFTPIWPFRKNQWMPIFIWCLPFEHVPWRPFRRESVAIGHPLCSYGHLEATNVSQWSLHREIPGFLTDIQKEPIYCNRQSDILCFCGYLEGIKAIQPSFNRNVVYFYGHTEETNEFHWPWLQFIVSLWPSGRNQSIPTGIWCHSICVSGPSTI